MDLKGSIPPMVTPVKDTDGEIDIDATKSYTRFLVDAGAHGLFPAGTIGEFPSLSRKQRSNLIRTVSAQSGDVPVIAGCGDTSLTATRNHIIDAAEAGADAAVVVTPYYYQATQEGLCSFYETLADDSALPIILYNIPSLTNQHLSKKSVERLSNHPRVIGLKDTSRNFEYFGNLCRSVSDSFIMLQGSPELSLASLEIGADGLINGPANIMPNIFKLLYDKYNEENRAEAFQMLQNIILPFIDITRPLPSPPALKHLISKLGYDVGGPLPPLQQLSSTQRDQLDKCYYDLVAPLYSSN